MCRTVSRDYPLYFPQPGWSEQNPQDWWTACMSGIPQLLEGVDPAQVAGIGVGGQMHGLVALDDQGQVLRPAILWNYGRTAPQVDWLNHQVGREVLSRHTANIAFAGFTAPKLLWMAQNEPDLFARIHKILLPKDYLVYCLTGVYATDYSDASGTLLLDVEHKTWSREMLELCHLREDQMPTLHKSWERVGALRGDVAHAMEEFVPIARAILGLKGLKVITFGPRPDDFLACNAPIKALYDLGVAVEENSELDLLVAYNKHADDPRIPAKMAEMEAELGDHDPYAGILPRLAQYELTLEDWARDHKGTRQYVAFANKCWPAFQTEFKFVPCYVNSRLAARGIPVACEVDIYGALSEYIGVCVSGGPTTLLDINNTVPQSMYDQCVCGKYDVRLNETFMGFHCGNTSCSLLKNPHMGYQLIMKRDLEPELAEPDITRGTMEGNIKAGDITFFRLQSTADTQLRAYIAQGQVMDVDCQSFGSIGAFAIPEMDRFYRHVLLAKRYPHHGAVAFGHHGKALYEVFKYLGVGDIAYNQPKSLPYPDENPFA